MPKARTKGGKRTVSQVVNEGCNTVNAYDSKIYPTKTGRRNMCQVANSKVKLKAISTEPGATTSSGVYGSDHVYENPTRNNNNWTVKKQNRQSSKCQRGRVHDRNRSHQNRNNSSSNDRFSNQRFTRQSKTKTPSSGENENKNSNSSTSCDIPGFFYDPEKKRYFKILPGQNNVNVVTRESIAEKAAEQKRLKDLEKELIFNTSVTSNSKVKFQSANYQLNNFVDILFGKHQGDLERNVIESAILKSQVERLKLSKSRKVFETPFGNYENLDHMLWMDPSPDMCDILCLWSVKYNFANRIQLLHANIKKKQFPAKNREVGLSLDVNLPYHFIKSLHKITHVCWAPSVESPCRKCILYTTMCYTGNSASLAWFQNLDTTTQEESQAADFCLGNKTPWTCAWNPYKNRFSVGTEKHGLLLDVESRKLWDIFSNNSDVLAQVFTSTDHGQCLLSGTRKGEILTHDLRSRSTYPVQTLRQHSPVSSLKLLQDEVYLLASDFTGKIKLWDLRMGKVVQKFKGHSNQYSKLPIHVDESENLLYLAGEDCYTRFWDLKTGVLVTSLPPPCPASRDFIPAVLYSQRWAGQWRQPGLVLGMKDKLHFYDNSQVWT